MLKLINIIEVVKEYEMKEEYRKVHPYLFGE